MTLATSASVFSTGLNVIVVSRIAWFQIATIAGASFGVARRIKW
jgi:hypothetical protein